MVTSLYNCTISNTLESQHIRVFLVFSVFLTHARFYPPSLVTLSLLHTHTCTHVVHALLEFTINDKNYKNLYQMQAINYVDIYFVCLLAYILFDIIKICPYFPQKQNKQATITQENHEIINFCLLQPYNSKVTELFRNANIIAYKTDAIIFDKVKYKTKIGGQKRNGVYKL